MECVPILFMSTPSFSVPISSTVLLMWFRICLLEISTLLFVDSSQNEFISDFPDVCGYDNTLLTFAAQICTGHRVCPDLCCVMLASFSPFFWLMKVIVTQSADFNTSSGDECAISVCIPFDCSLKKRIFSVHIIFVLRGPSLVFVDEYSHDLIAKKSAPQAKCPIASVNLDDLFLSRYSHTSIGKHCCDFRGGSVLV